MDREAVILSGSPVSSLQRVNQIRMCVTKHDGQSKRMKERPRFGNKGTYVSDEYNYTEK